MNQILLIQGKTDLFQLFYFSCGHVSYKVYKKANFQPSQRLHNQQLKLWNLIGPRCVLTDHVSSMNSSRALLSAVPTTLCQVQQYKKQSSLRGTISVKSSDYKLTRYCLMSLLNCLLVSHQVKKLNFSFIYNILLKCPYTAIWIRLLQNFSKVPK